MDYVFRFVKDVPVDFLLDLNFIDKSAMSGRGYEAPEQVALDELIIDVNFDSDANPTLNPIDTVETDATTTNSSSSFVASLLSGPSSRWLKCPGCKNPFRGWNVESPVVEYGPHPLLLNCGCSVCGTCIGNMKGEPPCVCPNCRAPLHQYALNTSLGEFSEAVWTEMTAAAGKLIEADDDGAGKECEHEDEAPVLLCATCSSEFDEEKPASVMCNGGRCVNKPLCEKHALPHKDMGHSVRLLASTVPTTKPSPPSQHSRCSRHPDTLLKYFCVNDDAVICGECIAFDHRETSQHEVLPLESVKGPLRDKLARLSQQCHVDAVSSLQASATVDGTAKAVLQRYHTSVECCRGFIEAELQRILTKHNNGASVLLNDQLKDLEAQSGMLSVCGGQLEAMHRMAERALACDDVYDIAAALQYTEKCMGGLIRQFGGPVVLPEDAATVTVRECVLTAGLVKAVGVKCDRDLTNKLRRNFNAKLSGPGLLSFLSGDSSANVIDVIVADTSGIELSERDVVFDAFVVDDVEHGIISTNRSVLASVSVSVELVGAGQFHVRIHYDVYDVDAIGLWLDVNGKLLCDNTIVRGTSVAKKRMMQLLDENAAMKAALDQTSSSLYAKTTELEKTRQGCNVRKTCAQLYRFGFDSAMLGLSSSLLENALRVLTKHVQDVTVQITGCRIIASLTTVHSNLALLIGGGALPALYTAMERHVGNQEVQVHGCAALCSISENEEGKLKMAADMAAFSRLFDALDRHVNSVEIQRLACTCLSSLSCKSRSAPMIVEQGGLKRLFVAMTGYVGNAEIQLQACSAISNLSVRQENHARIVIDGGLGPLLSAMDAHVEDIRIQTHVCASLENLSVEEEAIKASIVNEGGLARIVAVMGVHGDNAKLQTRACHILLNLSTVEDNKARMVAEKCVDSLVSSMRKHIGNLKVFKLEFVCGALCNLSTNHQAKVAIGSRDGLNPLLTAMQNHIKNAQLQTYVCGILYQLSTIEETQSVIVSSGALSRLFAVMETHVGNMDLQLFGCRVLCNVSMSHERRAYVTIPDALKRLFAAMEKHVSCIELQTCACTYLSGVSDDEPAASRIIASDGLKRLMAMMKNHIGVAHMQKLACKTIYNLSVHDDAKKCLMDNAGVLKRLFAAMDRHVASAEIQLLGCACLYRLSEYSEKATVVVKKGGIRRLIAAMDSHVNNAIVQKNACDALRSLALNDDNEVKIVDEGGLSRLFAAMDRHVDDARVQESACAALRNLAVHPGHETVIVAEGGLARLFATMESHGENAGVQVAACFALWNLTENIECQVKIVTEGGLTRLCEVMNRHINSVLIQEAVSGAFECLAENTRNLVHLLDAGVANRLLMSMALHVNSVKVQQHACRVLYHLADEGNPMSRLSLAEMDNEVLTRLFAAMENHVDVASVQEHVFDLLFRLAVNRDVRAIVVAPESLERVFAVMDAHLGNSRVQERACGIMRRLLTSEDSYVKVVNEGGLPRLYASMDKHKQNVTIQENALVALHRILQCLDYCMLVIESGGLARVQQAVGNHPTHVQIQRVGCDLLALLQLDRA